MILCRIQYSSLPTINILVPGEICPNWHNSPSPLGVLVVIEAVHLWLQTVLCHYFIQNDLAWMERGHLVLEPSQWDISPDLLEKMKNDAKPVLTPDGLVHRRWENIFNSNEPRSSRTEAVAPACVWMYEIEPFTSKGSIYSIMTLCVSMKKGEPIDL